MNQNFEDVVDFLNANVVQADGSVPMTGNLSVGDNRVTGVSAPSATTDAVNKAYADSVAPAGSILAYVGATAPTGWALCDGTSYVTATYPLTAAALGVVAANFNVPNLKGRVIVGVDGAQTEFDTLQETGGSKTHTLTTAEMPSHNHDVHRSATGVATQGGSAPYTIQAASGTSMGFVNSEGGGGAHNNLQPYMALNYIIRML